MFIGRFGLFFAYISFLNYILKKCIAYIFGSSAKVMDY